jgi:hypothetical protein
MLHILNYIQGCAQLQQKLIHPWYERSMQGQIMTWSMRLVVCEFRNTLGGLIFGCSMSKNNLESVLFNQLVFLNFLTAAIFRTSKSVLLDSSFSLGCKSEVVDKGKKRVQPLKKPKSTALMVLLLVLLSIYSSCSFCFWEILSRDSQDAAIPRF